MAKFTKKSVIKLATVPALSAGVMAVGGDGLLNQAMSAVGNINFLANNKFLGTGLIQQIKEITAPIDAHAVGTSRFTTNDDWVSKDGKSYVKISNFGIDKNTLASFSWNAAGQTQVVVENGSKFQLIADPNTNGASGDASNAGYTGHGFQYSGSTLQGQMNWLAGWNSILGSAGLGGALHGLEESTNGSSANFSPQTTTYSAQPGNKYRLTNVGRMLGTGHSLADANGQALDMIVTINSVAPGIKTSTGFGWSSAEGGTNGSLPGTTAGSWAPAIAFDQISSPGTSSGIGIYNLYTYDADMTVQFVQAGTWNQVGVSTLAQFADIDSTQYMYENLSNAAIAFMGRNLGINNGVVYTSDQNDDSTTDPDNQYYGLSNNVGSFDYHYVQQNTRDGYNSRGLFTTDGIVSTLFGRMAAMDVQVKTPLPNPNQPSISKNVLNQNDVNSDYSRPADIALSSSARNGGSALGYLSKGYYGSSSDDKQVGGIGTDYSNDEGWVTTGLSQASKQDQIQNARIPYAVNAYLDSTWDQGNITFNPTLHYTDNLSQNNLKAVQVQMRMPDGTTTDVSGDAIKDNGNSIDYTAYGQFPGDYTLLITAQPTSYQVKYPNTANVSVDFQQKYDDGSNADGDWASSNGPQKPNWGGNLIATNSVQVFPRVPVPDQPDVVKNVSGADVVATNGYTLDGYNHASDDNINSDSSYEGYYGKSGQASTLGDQIIWTPQINFDNTWQYDDNSGTHSYNPQIHLKDTIQSGLQIQSIEVLVNGVSKGFLPSNAASGNNIDYVWDGTGVPAGSSVKFKITTTVTDAWQGKFADQATLSVESLKNVAGYTDGRSETVNGQERTSLDTPDNFKNLQTNKVSVISDQQPEEPVKNVMDEAGMSSIDKLSDYSSYNHKSDDNLTTSEAVLKRRDSGFEWVITQRLSDYSQADGSRIYVDVHDDITANGRLKETHPNWAYYRYSTSPTNTEISDSASNGIAASSMSGDANDRTYHFTLENHVRTVEIHIPVQLANPSDYVTDLSMLSNVASSKVWVDNLPENNPGSTTINSTNKVGVTIPSGKPVKNVAQVNSQDLSGNSVTDQFTEYPLDSDGMRLYPDLTPNGWVWSESEFHTSDGYFEPRGSGDNTYDLIATSTRPQLYWSLDQQLGSGSDDTGSKAQLNQAITISDVLDPETSLGYMDDKGNFVAGQSNDGKSVIVYGVKSDGSKVDETKNFDVKVSSVDGSQISGGSMNASDFEGQPTTKISQERLDLTANDAAAFRQSYVAYHVEVKTVAHGGLISSQKIGNQFTSNIVWTAFNRMSQSNKLTVDRPKPKDSLSPTKVAQSTNGFGNRQYLKGMDQGDISQDMKATNNNVIGFGDVDLENPNDVVSFFVSANVPADRTSNYKSFTMSDDVNAAFEEQSVVGVYDVTEAMKQARMNPTDTEDLTNMVSAMYKAGSLNKAGSGVHDVSSSFDLTMNGKSVGYGSIQNPSDNNPLSWQVSAKQDALSQDGFYQDGLYLSKGSDNHMYNMNPLNGRYYVMLINAQPAGFNNDTEDLPNQGKIVVDGGDNPGTKYTPWTVVHVSAPKTFAAAKTTVDKADAIDAQTIDSNGSLIDGTAKDTSSGILYSQEDALRGDEDGSASDPDGPQKNTLASTKQVTRSIINYTIPFTYDDTVTSWSGDDHNFRIQDENGQFNTKANITIKGTSAITQIGGMTIDLTSDRSQGALMLAKMTTGHYAIQAVYLDDSNTGKTTDPIALQVIPLPSGWDKYNDYQKSDFMKQYSDNLQKQIKSDGAGRQWSNISKNATFNFKTWDSNQLSVKGNTAADRLATMTKTDAGKAVLGYMNYLTKVNQKTSVLNVKNFAQKGDTAGATLVAADDVLYYGSPFYGTQVQQLFDWNYNGNNTSDITVRNTATMSVNNQSTETNYVDTLVPKIKSPSISKFEADDAKATVSFDKDKNSSYLSDAATDATPDNTNDGTADMTVGRQEAYGYGFKVTVPGSNMSGFSVKDLQFKKDVLNNPTGMRAILADGTDVSSDFNFGYDSNDLPYMASKSPKIASTYQGTDIWFVLDGVSIKKDADLTQYADKNKAGSVIGYTIPDSGVLQYSAMDSQNPNNPYDPTDPDKTVSSNTVNTHLYQPADPQKFVSIDNGLNWDQTNENLKAHSDPFMWKTVYGNVNTKYLSQVNLVDYIATAQSADDVKILYTSNDGKVKDQDVTNQGDVKSTVVDSPLVKGGKAVKYSWTLKSGVTINGDLQLVVDNANIGDPSADEVPYLVNESSGLMGTNKQVIKLPNLAEESYTNEVSQQVTKKSNVPTVTIPDLQVPDVLTKSIAVMDGGNTAINGQAYLTDANLVNNTPQAGRVLTDATVTLTDSLGKTKTVDLPGIDLTDAYNNALKTNDLTKDAMQAALQAVVDNYAKGKGYVVDQKTTDGQKVTGITMGPLAITSVADAQAQNKVSAAGQAYDLKLMSANGALSKADAIQAKTYWSVAVYQLPASASDLPVDAAAITGANNDELQANLNKFLSAHQYDNSTKYGYYVQAVTSTDQSQSVTTLTKKVNYRQTVDYFTTATDGTVVNNTRIVPYTMLDNDNSLANVDWKTLAEQVGRQAMVNKFGQINWDAKSMVDGTLDQGGFIHINSWGTPTAQS